MDEKQKYEEIAIEVIRFQNVDVILTSNNGGNSPSTETPIHPASFF